MKFKSVLEIVQYYGGVDECLTEVYKACSAYAQRNPRLLTKICSGDIKISGVMLRDLQNFVDGYDYANKSHDLK